MIECCYAERRKSALYAECRYAECHYGECRGAFVRFFVFPFPNLVLNQIYFFNYDHSCLWGKIQTVEWTRGKNAAA